MPKQVKRPTFPSRSDNPNGNVFPLAKRVQPASRAGRIVQSANSRPAGRNRISEKLLPEQVDNPPAFYPQRTQFLNVIKDKLTENGYDGRRAIAIERELAAKESQYTYPMSIRKVVAKIATKKLDTVEVRNDEPTYNRELEKLLIPRDTLLKAHYIMDIPQKTSVDPTLEGKYLPCERCKVNFYPSSPSTTTAPCQFHLLKREYDPRIKKLANTYPCCASPLEHSNGCEKRNFHVFKLNDPQEMSIISPFRRAPDNDSARYAIGLDCEMAFTTWGFELIRLTMVDYNTRKVVLDELVKPFGEVLDLNTRFSGVTSLENAVTMDEMYTHMFEFIGSNTILIGHGLSNDLNVLRLVHDRIVDTALLYPRSRTRTFSLKELAFDFLSKNIQTGEHSSEEDSLATIDIVRKDIKQRLRIP